MGKFVIEPHFRLHEWVAEEKGYFKDEGLDYEFLELVQSTDGQNHNTQDKVGAYHVIEQGREVRRELRLPLDRECRGRRRATRSSMPMSIRCRRRASSCRRIRPCARRRILPACRSRSVTARAATTRRSRRSNNICRSTRSISRSPMACCSGGMELLVDRKVPAAALFSGPYYFAEQLGFRKVIDSTFMIATMITGDPDPEDVRKYFRALKRAQRDIDLRPERYTHYYRREFPVRFHEQMDTRRWGPGERIVFEPYTRDMFDDAQAWIAEHGIFPDDAWAAATTRSRC